MILDTPLRTERLLLRSLSRDDVGPAYVAWMNDPLVQRNLESRFAVHDVLSVQRFVEACNDSAGSLLLGLFGEGGRHIGNIKLGPIDANHGRASIGIMIGDRAAWGRGYAREAIACLCSHAFGAAGLRRVTAGCYAGNLTAIRAFERAGFSREGVLRGHAVQDGAAVDVVLLGRLAHEP